MRRHEALDTIGLTTVFVLSAMEALTHFGYHRSHGFCLSVPLMILSALLLAAVHWPRIRSSDDARPNRSSLTAKAGGHVDQIR